MKYLVKTHCLEWHDIGLIIEADSEELAEELVEELGGDVCYDNYDSTDQINIESIEPYED